MSWLDVVTDDRSVRGVYGDEEPPPLERVTVRSIDFQSSGPNVLIWLRLPSYPQRPPRKWAAQGFDTASLSLLIIDVEQARLTGWDVDVVGDLTLERFDDRVSVRLDSPDCTFSCSAVAVWVQEIRGFQSA
jgi:Immunity protein 50